MHSIYTLIFFRLFFIDISYRVISSTKFCGHGEGGIASYCQQPLTTISECEGQCTSFDWCIGYSTEYSWNCYLITSTGSCPNGWKGCNECNTATQSRELISSYLNPVDHSNFYCMAKGLSLIHI